MASRAADCYPQDRGRWTLALGTKTKGSRHDRDGSPEIVLDQCGYSGVFAGLDVDCLVRLAIAPRSVLARPILIGLGDRFRGNRP